MNQLFSYEGIEVRVAGEAEMPLFVAQDICRALGLQDTSSAVAGGGKVSAVGVSRGAAGDSAQGALRGVAECAGGGSAGGTAFGAGIPEPEVSGQRVVAPGVAVVWV